MKDNLGSRAFTYVVTPLAIGLMLGTYVLLFGWAIAKYVKDTRQ